MQPPRPAQWLLRRIVDGREGEILAGDLLEEFQSRGGGRLWYWRQVLSCTAVRLSPHRLAPDLGRDLHHSFRLLRRNPGYALSAMLCLALGIGVNTTVFSMVDELLLRRLPLRDPQRVVRIDRTGQEVTCGYREYQDIKRQSTAVLTGLSAVDDFPTALDTDGLSELIVAEVVSTDFADTLGLRPQLGRWFLPDDGRLTAEPVAVLSDHAWEKHFARDPNVIGRLVRIETQWYRVVGVASPQFKGVAPPVAAEIWMPFEANPIYREILANPAERRRPRVRLVGRLAPTVTLQQAEARLRVIDAPLQSEKLPGLIQVSVAQGAAFPGTRAIAGPIAALLFGVTAVVLIIASVNVANLLLSRAAVRRREMALRQAFGAGRWRLARQMLTESTVLAAGGALLGILVGFWTNRILLRSLSSIPESGTLSSVMLDLNWRVAAFAAVASLVSALLFTLSPILEHRRADLATALKGEGGAMRRMRQRDVYVVAQVALSMVLLVAAALLLRAMQHAQQIAPGFQMDHRLVARVYISEPEYTDTTGQAFFRRVLDDVGAMPGVRGASISYSVPLGVPSDPGCATIAGLPVRGGSNVVTPTYFAVLGIPLIAGRNFNASDTPNSPRVAIVNETLAKRFWPGESALGKTVALGCGAGKGAPVRVVGVAADAKTQSLDEAARPYFYTPLSQDFVGFMALTVHTAGEPRAFIAPLHSALRRIDPKLRIYEMRTLEETAALSLWKVRWEASLIGGFGLLAIVLAAVGLYGVVAYTVAQRTREIGIRMAVGAQKADVLWMVLGRGLRLTSIGIAIGLLLSAGTSRLLRSLLFGVSPLDSVAYLGAVLFWIATAMIASYPPARRAAKVDPLVALRWD